MKTFAFVLAFLSTSCAGFGGPPSPRVREIVARVDVAKILQCADRETAKDLARCLGARAMSEGLRIAYEEALGFAERAIEQSQRPSGSERANVEDPELARELDRSLIRVGLEIEKTHEGTPL